MAEEIYEAELIGIPIETRYWFVRTDGGDYFETFYENDFIGIGYNTVTPRLLQPNLQGRAKELIAQEGEFDPQESGGKMQITSAYNKLVRFAEMAKGDIVVIPSENSRELAFGKIASNRIFWQDEPDDGCPYKKRRRVVWLEKKPLRDLDPKFYEIRTSRHSISNVTPYAEYIDRAMLTFYFKNDSATLVLDILQERDIQVVPLLDLINGMQTSLDLINDFLNLDEDPNANVIKVNLQSRGLLAITVKTGKTLLIFGLLWAMFSCGSADAEKVQEAGITQQQLDTLARQVRPNIVKIDSAMDDLHADRDKWNNTFAEH